MEFRLLGPVEIVSACGALEVGPPKQRIVLASLLLTPRQAVPADVLAGRLWGEEPPLAARESLYAYIARLRRSLRQAADGDEPVRLLRGAGGYLIDVEPDGVDLHRFRRLVEEARTARTVGEDGRAVRRLREALAMWRGKPVAGLPGDWAVRLRDGLSQQRVAAMTQLGAVQLDCGRHADIVDDLAGWVAEHPLSEPLVAHLMLALYRSGRATEALMVYERTRRHLAEALGNDPARTLQLLHQQILRQDPALTPASAADTEAAGSAHAPAAPPPRRPVESVTPAQLPADVAAFAGRAEHLRRLDALLPDGDDGTPTVVISAIGGAAGVGKTALAVHWAHRVADRFPDGQLYVNLRGFDPDGSAMNPAEALRGFVDAFEVPPQRVPEDLTARAALYRSLLAGRRMLVVLDNARDADQVRPLLPGSPGCVAVVTSRNQLSGLVAAEGARPLVLDLLTATEARQMLARRVGAARVAAEPIAVDEIIERCARLPLALAIVAARAATHPDFPLGTLADELRDSRQRLDVLTGDDATTDVRAVFSWSYQTLGPGAGRLFRLLGLHPGPDFAAPAAASLAGVPVRYLRPLLAELTRGQLVREHTPGRYGFHDLLRAYATELAHQHDADDVRRAALHRLLDHYLHTAHGAGMLLEPYQEPITLAPPIAGVIREDLAEHEDALAWFAAEHSQLTAAVEQAARTGCDTHAWQLAWSLSPYFQRRGHWRDWATVQQTALDAARRLADPVGRAYAHRGLGAAQMWLGRYDEAQPHLRHAIELYDEVGNYNAQARTQLLRAALYARQERLQEAFDQTREAHDLYVATGNQTGRARTLNNMGWYSIQLGHHQAALAHCRKALTLQEEVGDRIGQANTWDSLGYAHYHLGEHTQAATCYQRAIDLYRELGDQYDQSSALTRLGDVLVASGDGVAARDAWQQALNIFDELGHPDAEQVRAKLVRFADGADQRSG
ncbi:BTAD domain-containing putative transcriptional regulator [Micromonospora sp. NPDC047738]|uniref:AfsR/SARP family transcriptional regulator n=1 Tax=Micromonospora sp. NPDC047738 TaxID=3155741 RepID=UPI00340B84DC